MEIRRSSHASCLRTATSEILVATERLNAHRNAHQTAGTMVVFVRQLARAPNGNDS